MIDDVTESADAARKGLLARGFRYSGIGRKSLVRNKPSNFGRAGQQPKSWVFPLQISGLDSEPGPNPATLRKWSTLVIYEPAEWSGNVAGPLRAADHGCRKGRPVRRQKAGNIAGFRTGYPAYRNTMSDPMRYPIAIEPGTATTAWGVAVPDLPGCFSAGDTIDEAIANATEAIDGWCESTVEAGGEIPVASTVADHLANPDYAGWIWAYASRGLNP